MFLAFRDVIYDNYSFADTNFIESIQTAAAKLILGCLKTTSHEEIWMNPRHYISIVSLTFLLHFVTHSLDPCLFSSLPLLPHFSRIFTIHRVFISMYSYLRAKLSLFTIQFFTKAQNFGSHSPLRFLL